MCLLRQDNKFQMVRKRMVKKRMVQKRISIIKGWLIKENDSSKRISIEKRWFKERLASKNDPKKDYHRKMIVQKSITIEKREKGLTV